MAFLLTATTLGCSDDDDDADASHTVGSCESIATFSVCDEFAADEETIADEREFCGEQAVDGYVWHDDPCPTTDLIGCCYDEFAGDEYRECFYTGYSETAAELADTCIAIDGEWRPGSR